MNIALDMMGGDYAPLEAVKGISLFIAEGDKNTTLTLIGDKAIVEALLLEHSIPTDSITVLHAAEVIGMHEHPTKALREKPQSSIAIFEAATASWT